jgi:hypothetical protein
MFIMNLDRLFYTFRNFMPYIQNSGLSSTDIETNGFPLIDTPLYLNYEDKAQIKRYIQPVEYNSNLIESRFALKRAKLALEKTHLLKLANQAARGFGKRK